MSEKTKNLGLFKYDTTTDAKQVFSIDKSMNANWDTIDSNTLAHRHITNCILEIPQRINYTLVDGTLTIKAGSVVIVPYGTEDLTAQYPIGSMFINDNFEVYDTQYEEGKFFIWAKLTQDISQNSTTTVTMQRYMGITIKNITNNTVLWAMNHLESGTNTTSTNTYTIFYNTQLNRIGYADGTKTINTDDYIIALPLFIGESNVDDNMLYHSIHKVFQGFFFMGACLFVDKGIKYLFDRGLNADGSLNNFIATHNDLKVIDRTVSTSTSNFILLAQYSTSKGVHYSCYWDRAVYIQEEEPTDLQGVFPYSSVMWFKPSLNKWFYLPQNSSTPYNWTHIATMVIGKLFKNGTTTYQEFVQTNQCVDILKRNDSCEISGWGMPSEKIIGLTLGASNTDYTAPANGWVYLRRAATAPGQFVALTTTMATRVYATASGQYLQVFTPVAKGHTFNVTYSAATAGLFTFIYAQGEV